MKSGRLSKGERSSIEKWGKDYTPQQIADKLNRRVDPIVEYLKKIGLSMIVTGKLPDFI